MYKLYYFRKDNEKVRKFDGHYSSYEAVCKRMELIKEKTYLSSNWAMCAVKENNYER